MPSTTLCGECGAPMPPSVRGRLTCSTTCRVNRHRRHHRESIAEAVALIARSDLDGAVAILRVVGGHRSA